VDGHIIGCYRIIWCHLAANSEIVNWGLLATGKSYNFQALFESLYRDRRAEKVLEFRLTSPKFNVLR